MLLPLHALAAETREILAHGSGSMYWISRYQHDDRTNAFRTLIQSRPILTGEQWLSIATLSQHVICLSNSGTKLAALLESGDWMLLWEGGSSYGTRPEDGYKLVQIAFDPDQREVLWGIADRTAGPATSSSTQPPGRALLLLDRGKWSVKAPLPPEAQRGDVSLVMFHNAPTLAALDDAQHVVRLFTFDAEANRWQVGPTVDAPQASQVKLVAGLDRLGLWVPGGNGGEFSFVDTGGAALGTPARLNVPDDLAARSVRDLTAPGQNIRLVAAATDASNQLLEFSYSPRDLSRGPTSNPIPVPGQVQAHPFDWLSTVLAAILMLMLLNSSRRHEPVAPEQLATHGMRLAPLGRRFLAGAIDAIPLVGTLLLISGTHSAEDLQNDPAFLYGFYFSSAVYILHTAVSEWLWGWTIGKRICGLRVAMIDGSKPDARAMLTRNLLRIVDLAIVPLLLIFISPLRQRGGDMAAETMVVVYEPMKDQPQITEDPT